MPWPERAEGAEPLGVTRVQVRPALTHEPDRHLTPTAHCAELPQRQPPAPQVSARRASQAAQRAPFVPH